ncbi:hypothetical protein ONZ45_g14685 [Pleurotus djamor]|nr:hypothetical protein ONZ45_g14685 [Pleurotus djamor]
MLQTTTKTEETLAIPELLSGEDPTLCGGDPRDRPSEEPYLMYGVCRRRRHPVQLRDDRHYKPPRRRRSGTAFTPWIPYVRHDIVADAPYAE